MPIHNPPSLLLAIPKKHGRSSSETAKDGVSVIFNGTYPTVPNVSIAPWQKSLVWLTEVTTNGFTWQSDKKVSAIDWIAVGEA